MDKKKSFFLLLVILIALIVGVFLYINSQKTGYAALRVNSNPKAKVYLDDKFVGETLYYDEKLKAKEYTVKIVPPDGSPQISYTTLVKLTTGTLTVISRELGENEASSSGEILRLDKITDKNGSEISVITNPDGAAVKVDNADQGQSPVVVKNVALGDHDILISKENYKDKLVRAKTIAGYQLVISVQLAESPKEVTPTPTPEVSLTPGAKTTLTPTKKLTPTPTTKVASGSATIEKPYVLIKDTPTGWLRVRETPSTTGIELAKVNPGDKYALVDSQTGWVKIKYEGTKTGWVSDQYVEKFE